MRQGVVVRLTSRDRRQLETIIRDPRSTSDAVCRSVVVLATADGLGTSEVMRLSSLSKPVVWRWQERYMHEGVAGLVPRRAGRPPTSWDLVHRLVKAMESWPPKESGRWTIRKLEAATGIPPATIHRICRRRRLPLERTKSGE
jgi:hypothetical protein